MTITASIRDVPTADRLAAIQQGLDEVPEPLRGAVEVAVLSGLEAGRSADAAMSDKDWVRKSTSFLGTGLALLAVHIVLGLTFGSFDDIRMVAGLFLGLGVACLGAALPGVLDFEYTKGSELALRGAGAFGSIALFLWWWGR